MSDADDPPSTPTGSWTRPVVVLGVLVALGVGGVYAYSSLRASLFQTPEQRALAEALGGLNDARSLQGPEREAKLREILRGLAKAREGKASETERALLDEALRAFGSGQRAGLEDVVQRLRDTRSADASPEERRALDALHALSGGQPAAPTRAPASDDEPPAASEPRVGQWVLIQHAGPDGEAPSFTYKWIAQITPEAITIKAQDLEDVSGERWAPRGAVYDAFAMRTPLVTPLAPVWETIRVGETPVRCFRVEGKGSGGSVTTWTSFDLPVFFGLYTVVRQVSSGERPTETTLLRYGTSGGGSHLRRD